MVQHERFQTPQGQNPIIQIQDQDNRCRTEAQEGKAVNESIWSLSEKDRSIAFAIRAAKGAKATREAAMGERKLRAPVEKEIIEDVSLDPDAWRQDLSDVAKKHDVCARDITSNFRDSNIVAARHELFYRLRTERNYSFERIGMLVGRDHSSVIHGFKRHAEKIGKAS